MTISERTGLDLTLQVAIFYDSSYAARTGDLEAAAAGIELVDGVTVAPVPDRAVNGGGDAGADADVALVFANAHVDGLPAETSIWVTGDPDVVTAAADDGALDVCTWAPDDDLDLLRAELRHRLDAAFGPDAATGTETAGEGTVRASKRIDDGVAALDADERITYCNETMAALLDAPDASPVGDTPWQHLPDVVTDEVRSVCRRALDDGVTTSTRVALDEQGHRLTVTAFPSGEGVAVHASGLSARRSPTHERGLYEYLIETVGDAVYILDDEGRFTFVNDALCEMTGYDRETLVGSSVHIIKDDETVDEAEDALRDLLRHRTDPDEDGIAIAELEVDLVRKDGEHVPCTDRMTLRPLGEGGAFQGTVGTLRDISTQKRREDILSGMLESAQEMVTAGTTGEVAEHVVETASKTLDVEVAVVRHHDTETDTLRPVRTAATTDRTFPDRPVYDSGEGPAGTAFLDGEPVVTTDLSHMDGTAPDWLGHGAYVPVGTDRLLSVATGATDGFDEDEVAFLELLAATAAPVFERVERDQERRRYEAVVEAAEDMLFTLDDEGRFTLVTESLASALGYDRDALTGKSVGDVVGDDAVATALADGVRETTTHETDLRTTAGEHLPSRVTAAPIEDDIGAGVVGSVRDISDLRSAQREATQQRRRFTELFETLQDPVADVQYVDGDPVVRSVNPAFDDLCTATTVRDTPLPEVCSTLPKGIADALEAAMAAGEAAEHTVNARTYAGERHYILKTVPYEGDDGRRAFIILTDVTDVKHRETQLQVLYRLLRHNLRNRTTVIQGTAEAIIERDTDPTIDDMAERIYDASKALVDASDTARTIQQVLEDTRDARSVPVAEVARTVEERVARQFPTADVTVRVATDGTVTCSDDLVTGVLELVENAVEHAEGDDPTVRVELTDAPAADEVTVAVHDDGPGIPDAEWEVITGDHEITQLRHASGLGLWLVKWVADTHKGTLRLEAADEDGSTVAIDLPR